MKNSYLLKLSFYLNDYLCNDVIGIIYEYYKIDIKGDEINKILLKIEHKDRVHEICIYNNLFYVWYWSCYGKNHRVEKYLLDGSYFDGRQIGSFRYYIFIGKVVLNEVAIDSEDIVSNQKEKDFLSGKIQIHGKELFFLHNRNICSYPIKYIGTSLIDCDTTNKIFEFEARSFICMRVDSYYVYVLCKGYVNSDLLILIFDRETTKLIDTILINLKYEPFPIRYVNHSFVIEKNQFIISMIEKDCNDSVLVIYDINNKNRYIKYLKYAIKNMFTYDDKLYILDENYCVREFI